MSPIFRRPKFVPELSSRLLFHQGDEDNVSTLFILEAPFDDELINKCPCCGEAGKSMSKALSNDKIDTPLGLILSKKEKFIKSAEKYAIFDTFKFPIDLSVASKLNAKPSLLWTPEKEPWTHLKTIDDYEGENHRYNIEHHLVALQKYIGTIPEVIRTNFFEEYKKDLANAVAMFPNLNNIAVCGYIAQCIFNIAYNFPQGEKKFSTTYFSQSGKKYYFIEHPMAAYYRNYEPLWSYTPRS